MDWVATLLEAAGAHPDPAYPLDGVSLLAQLTGQAPPIPRKLFWRFHANDQMAIRDGDMKWLKIRNNDFLFNVVDDPLERAQLKARQPDIYQHLIAEYKAWNATMLPIDPKSNTSYIKGSERADHYGVE